MAEAVAEERKEEKSLSLCVRVRVEKRGEVSMRACVVRILPSSYSQTHSQALSLWALFRCGRLFTEEHEKAGVLWCRPRITQPSTAIEASTFLLPSSNLLQNLGFSLTLAARAVFRLFCLPSVCLLACFTLKFPLTLVSFPPNIVPSIRYMWACGRWLDLLLACVAWANAQRAVNG